MESEFEEEDAFTLVVDVDRQFYKKKKKQLGHNKKRAYSEWIKGIELQKRVRLNTLTFKGAQ